MDELGMAGLILWTFVIFLFGVASGHSCGDEPEIACQAACFAKGEETFIMKGEECWCQTSTTAFRYVAPALKGK